MERRYGPATGGVAWIKAGPAAAEIQAADVVMRGDLGKKTNGVHVPVRRWHTRHFVLLRSLSGTRDNTLLYTAAADEGTPRAALSLARLIACRWDQARTHLALSAAHLASGHCSPRSLLVAVPWTRRRTYSFRFVSPLTTARS